MLSIFSQLFLTASARVVLRFLFPTAAISLLVLLIASACSAPVPEWVQQPVCPYQHPECPNALRVTGKYGVLFVPLQERLETYEQMTLWSRLLNGETTERAAKYCSPALLAKFPQRNTAWNDEIQQLSEACFQQQAQSTERIVDTHCGNPSPRMLCRYEPDSLAPAPPCRFSLGETGERAGREHHVSDIFRIYFEGRLLVCEVISGSNPSKADCERVAQFCLQAHLSEQYEELALPVFEAVEALDNELAPIVGPRGSKNWDRFGWCIENHRKEHKIWHDRFIRYMAQMKKIRDGVCAGFVVPDAAKNAFKLPNQ